MIKRTIPSTGEQLPVIGLGTWQTFDVKENSYPELEKVLTLLHQSGGSLIDSSPMYGKAEQVIGDITSGMKAANDFFYATKVWTTVKREGVLQMESSMHKMKRPVMDLIQIHNLTDWRTHLETLRGWKKEGKVRYIGITHYTDSMHDELEKIFTREKMDFVQFNYSIQSCHAENRLLKAAQDHGVATLINRPFGEGKLFYQVRGKALPPWATDIGVTNWASFFLKYILSHTAVTCVIPATSNPAHAAEMLEAGKGTFPDEAYKKKMIEYIQSL